MKRDGRALAWAAAAAWLLACGDGGESARPAAGAAAGEAAPAAPAPPAPQAAPAGAAVPPAAAGAEAAPPPARPGDAAKGQPLYVNLCASCHGERGDGDGPLAAALSPHPARHSDGAYMNALSDEHLFRVIKEGGPAVGKSPLMAPWASALRDDQIRDVIAFIRSLADPPYAPRRS
jgi:mono/diheme cytochrome c family protein